MFRLLKFEDDEAEIEKKELTLKQLKRSIKRKKGIEVAGRIMEWGIKKKELQGKQNYRTIIPWKEGKDKKEW